MGRGGGAIIGDSGFEFRIGFYVFRKPVFKGLGSCA